VKGNTGRSTVFLGRLLAAYAAAASLLLLFLTNLIAKGMSHFGTATVPWQLGAFAFLAAAHLAAVSGTTFLMGPLFEASAFGFVLTVPLFLIGFTLIPTFVSALEHLEPWMASSDRSGTIGGEYGPVGNWALTRSYVLMNGEIHKNAMIRIYTVAGGRGGRSEHGRLNADHNSGGLRLSERDDSRRHFRVPLGRVPRGRNFGVTHASSRQRLARCCLACPFRRTGCLVVASSATTLGGVRARPTRIVAKRAPRTIDPGGRPPR